MAAAGAAAAADAPKSEGSLGDATSNPLSVNGAAAAFRLKDATIENTRHMRVICIGAGFSGIYMGIRIPEWLRNIDFTIYDKNDGVGGTWWENRYPGCACDIPAHSYVFTFEPNPKWSTFYATASEIQRYLAHVAEKYSVNRFIKLKHKITKCTWDAGSCKWKVEIEKVDTGETFIDEADVVVNAKGPLNTFQWPDIQDLWSFKGKIVHSAIWDTSYDYSDKTIGVVGSGSSAIQIVPQLQRLNGVKIKSFIRSKTWISATFGESAMQKLNLDHNEFTEEDHQRLMSDDKKYHAFRKTIETEGNAMHPFSLKGSALSDFARKEFTNLMQTRLAKRPDMAEFLIPSFAPGCRRLTPGPGFLEALTENNVEMITSPIKAMKPNGTLLENGQVVDLDVLVCATGFSACDAPPFPIVGVNGKTLKERYAQFPEAYMGVVTDGFPNFFHVLGANSGVASGSLTKIIESQGDYIVKCIRKLQKEDLRSMDISARAIRAWVRLVESYFPQTVFLDDCKTWYRRRDRIIGLWPGSTLHALEALRSPRWEDYEYVHLDEDDPEHNILGWLGNGWTDIQRENGDLSWYIEPEHIDFPSAPLPEKTEQWQKVIFSH